MNAAVPLKKLAFLFLLMMTGACGALRAQNFDAAIGSAPMLPLDGTWRRDAAQHWGHYRVEGEAAGLFDRWS
jgi:hypothetical protein